MHYLTIFLLACLSCGVTQAAEVQVAVASNFTAPMKKIAAAFEKNTGHKTVLSFGATGKLFAQITNGAPFDVFLSADDKTPAMLEKDNAAVAGTRMTYATGRLVLWSARADAVDANGAVLTQKSFKHLAIAAPKLAPYGAAAIDAMTNLGVLASLQRSLVTGDSIGQAYGMVASGNADLGFVALSQVLEGGQLKSGSAWVVPANLHSPLRQDAVLLIKGKNNLAAVQLLTFLKSSQARVVMASFGYE